MASQCVRNHCLDTADRSCSPARVLSGHPTKGVEMIIRGDILLFPCILALITLVAVSVCATGVGAQAGMFSAGDGYERFMGGWSRELAPLLVKFARVRNGDAVLDVGSGTGALTALSPRLPRSKREHSIREPETDRRYRQTDADAQRQSPGA